MTSPSVQEHRDKGRGPVRCAVLTVSDTRTLETDEGGRLVVQLLESAGHVVVRRGIVPDEPAEIRTWLDQALGDPNVQAVLTTGGTGIAPRDRTCEVVSEVLEKRLDGFGELFRMLSYQEVGPAAMLSRAVGGVARGKVVLAMPGSPAAVQLAMEKLVLPELGHLVWEASRPPRPRVGEGEAGR
ncbi:MAG: MogA/MoaB family molybdenum cofactor biosynthesis protein [Armatimonadota bacterium]|nr:MogA/MoaB family molybdenum cofactor biosynthesis protein [Armatimonadota bacterium]MDR5690124.1 MogA/MoaB family molybdenum cofactor biosynthesis protein [Armatimonadota bacterium]MDR7390324.1 MogA/MoaB family molybdenum cofactor biosynthesis protein [Armatimonadota bacterium]MDR7397593.1 MogA/MoaB family molybdenum cofactor biosynthesis protein [Armatimonadota bacterium]MDR7400002.1 MogA/MoaB family molybdenum cofactor biosynthesis protein [Armatimonadota bacterium]